MRPWHVLGCLCLCSSISGCAETVRTQFQYVPDAMLVDCPVTPKPANMTFGDVAALAEARFNDVGNCNAGFAAIRQYQAERKAKDAEISP